MSTIKELMKSQDFNAVKEVLRKEYKDIKDIKSFEDTFETICRINPTYDYFDSIILIKKSGNAVRVTNTHLGSLSDLAGRNYKKESGITDVEAAAHSLYQIVAHTYETERYKDHLSDWEDDMGDFMNPQKARIVR